MSFVRSVSHTTPGGDLVTESPELKTVRNAAPQLLRKPGNLTIRTGSR